MSPALTLRVEKLIPGGKGFARLPDGRVALLQAVVPGDQVELLKTQDRKGYVEVTDWRMLAASTERVSPPCPVASACGGCDWMMLSETEQNRAKLSLVREALARTGKISELPEPFELVKGKASLGYRSRIRLQVNPTGKVGFHSPASHDLVEVESCAVAAPELNHTLRRLREWTHERPEALRNVEYVELRNAPGGPVTTHFVGRKHGSGSTRNPQLLGELPRELQLCVDAEARDPTTWQSYPLPAGTTLRAPPGTFTQVNWEVNQLLIEHLLQGAVQRGARSFADLYCGSGNFSLPLLARGLVGIGVESNALAVEALSTAMREQRFSSLRLVRQDVAEFAPAAARRGERYDLVIVDPPRAGIKADLAAICELALHHIAICSCDPVTLARDLRGLLDRGFTLEKITAFDMFPQTHHVELLVWLSRKPAS